MSFEAALRATDLLLALALLQHSAEHLAQRQGRAVFGLRIALAGLLATGLAPLWACVGLLGTALVLLHRFDGPYNGGSDRMSLLVLICLTGAHAAPTVALAELAMGYLALQLIWSYVMSGLVKLANPLWRTGQALVDVFRFSAYPVSEGLRGWADHPRVMWVSGWAVMLFEAAFPLALVHPHALWLALAGAAAFHLVNGCVFGLNRFFWAWLSAYPSILWLQDRLVGAA